MKKVLSILLTLVALLAFIACENPETPDHITFKVKDPEGVGVISYVFVLNDSPVGEDKEGILATGDTTLWTVPIDSSVKVYEYRLYPYDEGMSLPHESHGTIVIEPGKFVYYVETPKPPAVECTYNVSISLPSTGFVSDADKLQYVIGEEKPDSYRAEIRTVDKNAEGKYDIELGIYEGRSEHIWVRPLSIRGQSLSDFSKCEVPAGESADAVISVTPSIEWYGKLLLDVKASFYADIVKFKIHSQPGKDYSWNPQSPENNAYYFPSGSQLMTDIWDDEHPDLSGQGAREKKLEDVQFDMISGKETKVSLDFTDYDNIPRINVRIDHETEYARQYVVACKFNGNYQEITRYASKLDPGQTEMILWGMPSDLQSVEIYDVKDNKSKFEIGIVEIIRNGYNIVWSY